MIKLRDVFHAYNRIRPYIRETPMEYSHYYSDLINGEVYLKLENLQVTGSFKVRGAFNKMLSLDEKDIKRGIVTASAGNHGKAIAYASRMLNVDALVFVPSNAPANKIADIRRYGAKVEVCEGYYEDAEAKAREYSRTSGKLYISPYNDDVIIAGQGTISIEILGEERDIEFILVPVGGGGLISGIAYTVKNIDPNIEVIGVQSEASPVMYESLRHGRIIKVEIKPSIAEGLHGLIEENSITFDYVSRFVDDIILVSENEIEREIVELIRQHRLIAEGAGVVGLAALKRYKDMFKGRKGVVVISGGNIDFNVVKRLISNY